MLSESMTRTSLRQLLDWRLQPRHGRVIRAIRVILLPASCFCESLVNWLLSHRSVGFRGGPPAARGLKSLWRSRADSERPGGSGGTHRDRSQRASESCSETAESAESESPTFDSESEIATRAIHARALTRPAHPSHSQSRISAGRPGDAEQRRVPSARSGIGGRFRSAAPPAVAQAGKSTAGGGRQIRVGGFRREDRDPKSLRVLPADRAAAVGFRRRPAAGETHLDEDA
jgi:hypothetical protein